VREIIKCLKCGHDMNEEGISFNGYPRFVCGNCHEAIAIMDGPTTKEVTESKSSIWPPLMFFADRMFSDEVRVIMKESILRGINNGFFIIDASTDVFQMVDGRWSRIREKPE